MTTLPAQPTCKYNFLWDTLPKRILKTRPLTTKDSKLTTLAANHMKTQAKIYSKSKNPLI